MTAALPSIRVCESVNKAVLKGVSWKITLYFGALRGTQSKVRTIGAAISDKKV